MRACIRDEVVAFAFGGSVIMREEEGEWGCEGEKSQRGGERVRERESERERERESERAREREREREWRGM